jgi:hypothetical protein
MVETNRLLGSYRFIRIEVVKLWTWPVLEDGSELMDAILADSICIILARVSSVVTDIKAGTHVLSEISPKIQGLTERLADLRLHPLPY